MFCCFLVAYGKTLTSPHFTVESPNYKAEQIESQELSQKEFCILSADLALMLIVANCDGLMIPCGSGSVNVHSHFLLSPQRLLSSETQLESSKMDAEILVIQSRCLVTS